MGFFDFVSDIGNKIFGKDMPGAEDIQKLLGDDLGDAIMNLKVELEDGIVGLYGECDTFATHQKGILLAGNVQGVEKVNDDYFFVRAQEEEEEKTVFYTIQSGDSLSKIAKKYYADPMKYPALFEANREVIKDPDLIFPGQQIRIPKLGE